MGFFHLLKKYCISTSVSATYRNGLISEMKLFTTHSTDIIPHTTTSHVVTTYSQYVLYKLDSYTTNTSSNIVENKLTITHTIFFDQKTISNLCWFLGKI